MTELTISTLDPMPMAVLELWGVPAPTAKRLAKALGHALPKAGRAEGRVMRLGPTTWLIEGEHADLAGPLGEGGALTEVGGGYARVRISGAGWRELLMEGGLFDAESADFATDCVATTLIEHVTVTLRVESEASCLAYVPASQAADLLHFWLQVRVLVQA